MHCGVSVQICVSQRINLYWMANNTQKGADSTEEMFQLNPDLSLHREDNVMEPINFLHPRLLKLRFEDLNGILVDLISN